MPSEYPFDANDKNNDNHGNNDPNNIALDITKDGIKLYLMYIQYYNTALLQLLNSIYNNVSTIDETSDT